jgi:predicted esterase
VVFLHGASRTVLPFVVAHREAANEAGVAILAPYSVADTWDGVHGAYDKDIASLDVMLQWFFHHIPVHPASVTMSGFSDGAVYALAVGRANGSLFKRIVAYSPHSLLETDVQGLPPVLISHGTSDQLVPWDVSAEHIVPQLRERGHEVEFASFDGGHAVPLALIRETVEVARALA